MYLRYNLENYYYDKEKKKEVINDKEKAIKNYIRKTST